MNSLGNNQHCPVIQQSHRNSLSIPQSLAILGICRVVVSELCYRWALRWPSLTTATKVCVCVSCFWREPSFAAMCRAPIVSWASRIFPVCGRKQRRGRGKIPHLIMRMRTRGKYGWLVRLGHQVCGFQIVHNTPAVKLVFTHKDCHSGVFTQSLPLSLCVCMCVCTHNRPFPCKSVH